MTRKIFFLFAMIVGFAMSAMAAKSAAPDSVFVVKNGRIVSAYEVGKDIDNITFQKKVPLTGNSVRFGDEVVEMKSAILMQQNGIQYVFLSTNENATTLSEVSASGKYVQITMPATLLGEKITFSKFGDEFDDDDFFQVTFNDVDKYDSDDDYEPLIFDADGYSDYFTDGTLSVSTDDDDNLKVDIDCEPVEGGNAFAAQYSGDYHEIQQSPYYFEVDGDRKELRAVFAEKVADGIAFYLTSGNIDKANDLENCNHYARLFVPTKEMDGNDIDINGSKEYELTFYDNTTDPAQVISLYQGKQTKATGYVSVLDRGDGSYTVIVDVEGMGNGGDRDLKIVYKGTPMTYDLSIPSNYTVAGGDPVDLKSAVCVVDGSDPDRDIYTVYLSRKEGITTVEGMADADIVLTVPDDFVNDDSTHGFSGTEVNAMQSIAYGGVTYSQANTGNAANAIAAGGNMKVTVNAGKANIDFTIFSSQKLGGSLKGHYEGDITKINK